MPVVLRIRKVGYCVHMNQDDWATAQVRRIGAKVKQLRRGRFTAEELAQTVESMGYRPYSRAALMNLEQGRKRTVDVGELLVLAKALQVPPLLLLYPGMTAGEVEVLPGHLASSWGAAQWFGGVAPFQATDEAGRFVYDRVAFDEGARVLELARQEHQLIEQLAFVRRQRDATTRRENTTTGELLKANEHASNVEQQLRAVGGQITDLGGQPFPVAEDAAAAVGVDTDRCTAPGPTPGSPRSGLPGPR